MTPKHPTIEVRRRKRRAIAKIHRDAERKRTELGFVPDPTKPVTPRTFLITYQASSVMIILMRT